MRIAFNISDHQGSQHERYMCSMFDVSLKAARDYHRASHGLTGHILKKPCRKSRYVMEEVVCRTWCQSGETVATDR